MDKYTKKALVLVVVAVATVAMLMLVQPLLYYRLSSDFNRHQVLEEVLAKEQHESETAGLVFGDSRAMFGVDTREVASVAGLSPEAYIYNVSSVGQGLYESNYYYTQVKDSMRWVAQCLSVAYFFKDIPHKLDPGKNISMFLSGYRIDDATRDLLGEYDPFFDRSPIINLLDSRTYFPTYIHQGLRPYLDNERFDAKQKLSRYFPHIYTEPQHPNYPNGKYDCSRYCKESEPTSQLEILRRAAAHFHSKGTNYILVLMPINPDACQDCKADFEGYKRLIQEVPHLQVLDITDVLLPSQFYDLIHANKAGAAVISQKLGEYLRTIPAL